MRVKICILVVKDMSQKSFERKVLISAIIDKKDDTEITANLIKDEDINEYYLTISMFGWRQISDIQKAWDLLIKYKYYVKKEVVPLIYYILTINPKQINDIFEFLYQNGFVTLEEDNE